MPSSPADFYLYKADRPTPFPGAIDRFHHFLVRSLEYATSVVLAVYIQVSGQNQPSTTPGFPVQVPALRWRTYRHSRVLDIRSLTQLLEVVAQTHPSTSRSGNCASLPLSNNFSICARSSAV